MRHKRLIATTLAATAVALAAWLPSAFGAASGPERAFVCHSLGQLNPDTAAANDTGIFPTWNTFADGWWSPYATKTAVGSTKVGSYYLTCSLPEGQQTKTGAFIANGGELVPLINYTYHGSAIPGIYPVVETPTTSATNPPTGS